MVYRYADRPIPSDTNYRPCNDQNRPLQTLSRVSIWAICTGPPADQYADHSLLGDTTDWGCFRPITTRNRPIMVDFDRYRPLSSDNG
ncbi:hypothetical protein GW17_00052530 [Ensete ventricosum]|nr:hypothetical protein GW17_00052530 [Ensete ventricosum]